jgi:hypothetical protein
MAQDYDVTFKMLLRDAFERAVHAATGLLIERWLDVELPRIRNPRMDVLGETVGPAPSLGAPNRRPLRQRGR